MTPGKSKFLSGIIISVAVLLIVAAFVLGRAMEYAKSGYRYEIREEKEIDSANGPVHWKYVTECVGVPFLDPGTTLIEIDGRLIYKARRVFQDRVPFARNLRSNDGIIEWEDGDYSFRLKMEKLSQPGTVHEAPASPTTSNAQ